MADRVRVVLGFDCETPLLATASALCYLSRWMESICGNRQAARQEL